MQHMIESFVHSIVWSYKWNLFLSRCSPPLLLAWVVPPRFSWLAGFRSLSRNLQRNMAASSDSTSSARQRWRLIVCMFNLRR